MEYRLVNENFKHDYIRNLVSLYGADADKLLNPQEADVQSPSDLDNIELGAKLLHNVVSNNGIIGVVVDCDVDGYSSSAIIWQYIHLLNPTQRLYYYVHSGKQHGLEDLIDEIELNQDNLDLLILPDSSSNDEVYHYRLKDIGIPVLVLDHHEANQYSNSAIVINNQLSKNYKNKKLTGAGVTYQFCRYYDQKYGYSFADNFIDLAALGIISDMGEVIEPENAYIIKKGLSKFPKNYFFDTLLAKQAYSIGNNLSSISISFYIAPLINALIRVGTFQQKEDLFLAFIDGHKIVPSTKRGEKGKTEELAVQVTRGCINARAHQNRILDSALERITFRIEDEGLDKNKLLIIELTEEDELPTTLNGLLAMKLVAKYKRPTLVLRTNTEGIARGSLRGINNSPFKDLRGYLNSTELCEYAQGHAQAAGAGIKHSNIKKLIEKSNEELKEYDFGKTYYEVNFIRKAQETDIFNIIYDIDKYRPIYGQGCQEPIVAITNIDVSKNDFQIIGKNKDTINLTYNGITYMFFHAKPLIDILENLSFSNIRLEIVGKANLNEWGGKITPQIFVEDYNIFDSSLMF